MKCLTVYTGNQTPDQTRHGSPCTTDSLVVISSVCFLRPSLAVSFTRQHPNTTLAHFLPKQTHNLISLVRGECRMNEMCVCVFSGQNHSEHKQQQHRGEKQRVDDSETAGAAEQTRLMTDSKIPGLSCRVS